VLETTREEHRALAPPVVAPKLKVVALASHTGDDVTGSAPVVEAAVESTQFWLARLEGEEAEVGGGRGAAVAHPRFPSIHWRASCSTRRLASL
jgi:hypothetical protein